MERQECQDKQSFCYGWKKKYKLFIVTLATLTIQWERQVINGQRVIWQSKKREINDWSKNWDRTNCIVEWKTYYFYQEDLKFGLEE